ncbi:MAG: bifunctional adenosylcobinamide kinase/adenosylcobinamide-phosphate guanylyltransferase [Lachnospiraceae bacterium]|nr:bifunctional adenosylcobinamide kinase/adenosylcobinamide-phosphate guanylyltransferase [Lachnospiraceae bacterium]
MILVTGGSGSGKSSYAEEIAMMLAEGNNTIKYYLATMQVYDEEGRRKVERHRTLRSWKGFCTIEQPTNIQEALAEMNTGKKTILLECISNLTANEMFADRQPRAVAEVAEKIVGGVEQLKANTTHLVVVTNNVFEDGIIYDATTLAYIRAIGRINQQLAGLAQQVVEVVAGIPVIVKQ